MDPSKRIYTLGLTRQDYVLAPKEEREAAVQQLVAARSAVATKWSELLQGDTDALSIMRKLREIFRTTTEIAPKLFPQDESGYLVTFVCRKVVLALLASGRASVDWQSLSSQELMELCCDQNGCLTTFDKLWSAADVSNFVFGRPDWGIFVSMDSCLWEDVTTSKLFSPQVMQDILVQRIESGEFEQAAAELRSSCGHAVHPAIVVKKLREFQLL